MLDENAEHDHLDSLVLGVRIAGASAYKFHGLDAVQDSVGLRPFVFTVRMAGQEKVGVDGKSAHVQELVEAFLSVSMPFSMVCFSDNRSASYVSVM